ncbi:MAG: response regulator [Pseudomonadota bacterium]|nr:response regulator [Pseudomonadota bacterium]
MGKSILIVEDEKVSCLFLSHCVTDMGHQVAGTATTGEEAIEKAGTLGPSLVIMDVGLKGEMSGAQVADIIYRRHRIPILFISAYTHEEICRTNTLPEVFDYLPKPIDGGQLEQKIAAIFDRKGE